jgi:hypothetical protein
MMHAPITIIKMPRTFRKIGGMNKSLDGIRN